MVQLSLAPAVNKNLFSRHYLEERLPDSDIWQKDEEEARKAWEDLKELYHKQKDELPNRDDDEEGLRDKFISKILGNVLNFKYEKEKSTPGANIPDYALFKNEEDRKDAVNNKGEKSFYRNAIAILEAKAWGKKLEMRKKGGGRKYSENNPTVQIMEYLYNAEPKWGILTNGKTWKIFHQEESSNRDTYYEVDLTTILENDDFKQFRYFYFLFRKEAYRGKPGKKYIDRVRTNSNRYSKEIGEDLEDNLYWSLLWLARGYFDVNTNDLDPEEDMELVYEKSLFLLYRLLFLFYTYSREIMDDPAKKGHPHYSFMDLVDEILEDIENNDVDPISVSYRNRLVDIFNMVDHGSEYHDISRDEMFIPPYNGELFKMEEEDGSKVFFKEYTLRDKYLAKVIKLLARRQDSKERVDYADLSVRHLGGIYEGLLEHKLRLAEEHPVVCVKNEWIPASEADRDFDEFEEKYRAKKGGVYLATDKGERKATGSYYTPDYIVKYIVENTVEPEIKRRIDENAPDEENRKAILDMDVLDPAMGSGHFLVEAIDKIASYLMKYIDEKEPKEVKRMVARQCIYGVDVNPLATELAKVSVWLNTISGEKPLSFLNHHFKTGNSLIGADIFDLDSHPEAEDEKTEDEGSERQMTLAEKFGGEDDGQKIQESIKHLLNMYKRIVEKQEKAPDDIKEQADIYEEFEENKFRRRFDVLADVYTSYYFDNEFSKEDYRKLLEAFQPGSGKWDEIKEKEWIQKATDALENSKEENLSKEYKFFHWKLGFPEVFFDIDTGRKKDNPGFDAVVGNPPYVKVQTMPEEIKDYFREKYSTASGKFDLYIPFTEKANQIVGPGKNFSYIMPSKFTETQSGKNLRKFFLNLATLKQYVDFSDYQVFEDVITYTCVFVAQRNTPKDDNEIDYKKIYDRADLEKGEFNKIRYKLLDEDTWNLSKYGSELYEISKELKSSEETVDLDTVFKHISKGIDPGGSTDIFVVDEERAQNLEEELVKPVIPGDSISKYNIESDQYIIFPYRKDSGEYVVIPEDELEGTEVYNYLKDYEEKLKDRDYVLDAGKRWYELWNERQPKNQEVEKLVICNMSKENRFAYDKKSRNTLHTTYSLVPESPEADIAYLNGILSSKLLTAIFSIQSTTVKGGYYRYNRMYLKDLPITTKDHSKEQVSNLVEKISKEKSELNSINLNIPDYLGNYSDGETLGDLYTPTEGLSERILSDTTVDRNNLRIGNVGFEEESGQIILKASARYKPENEEEFETDRWGYTETEMVPAMKFTGLSEMEKTLVKEFTKLAVDEAGGFSNFRENATKSKSIIDRLEELTLPKLEDVETGLKKYLEEKERAEKLEEEIKETDHKIDAIVFDLYDLTEEEVKTVLDSLDTPEDEKEDILEKFREVN